MRFHIIAAPKIVIELIEMAGVRKIVGGCETGDWSVGDIVKFK